VHDLVIRGGTVVDGLGGPGRRADVAVADGRVVAVGEVDGRGAEEVDAEGHVVSPGFVDLHTHMDAQVFWDPLGRSSCWHGVTTVVMGNCGFTLAPGSAAGRALVLRNLEQAEEIPAASMEQGIDWGWSTFREHLAVLDRLPKGINYAPNIGHSALRTWVMGERAFDGPATDDDLAAMERELRDALAAGAVGFTTSRADSHTTSDERPVASRLADWAEVQRLVGVLGEVGGVFELALELEARSEDPAERAEFLGRLRDLALASGAPITFGVQIGTPGLDDQLATIDDTVAAGGRMFGLTHSRGIHIVSSFATRLDFDVLAEWRPVRALPRAAQMAALRDPDVRRRLVDAAHHGTYVSPAGIGGRRPDFTKLRVFDDPLGANPTVAEAAAARGVDPVELMIDLALASDFAQLFSRPAFGLVTSDLERVMRHPNTVMTFSDSGAHVSQIMDSSIQTHLLAHWVRERQAFTLEEAVRMITSAPAAAWGFPDRGVVAPGFAADLNVFDPAAVGPCLPTVVADLPAGARRLDQRATGFRATVVNGEVLLRDGEPTGRLPGRLVRVGQPAG
jgi:N-acyl-D-aspartate/D-glutamate deacylase